MAEGEQETKWVFPELHIEEGPAEDEIQAAEAKFEKAKDLYKKGEFDEAIELLADVASVMYPSPSPLLPLFDLFSRGGSPRRFLGMARSR